LTFSELNECREIVKAVQGYASSTCSGGKINRVRDMVIAAEIVLKA